MKEEIIQLLKKEASLSQESINEIKPDNINDYASLIRKIGKNKTEHIKASEISNELDTSYIGRNLYIYREVNSTNTLAKFLSENGAENGSVVISEKQNGARGRSGKSWESPLGGVWLSIIVHPDVDHSKIPLITLATGVAVAKALERIGVEKPEIKWPNDIMINGKKVCGILTEATTKHRTIENVIIGVGIDVNIDIDEFSKDLRNKTTSLEFELKRNVDENLLIKLFLEEFENINELFNNESYEEILNEWRKRSYSIGKTVEVRKPFNRYYDAYVVGISKDGSLIVEKLDGSLEKVISAECRIKK